MSQDRAWVYFLSNSPSWGIYRVPFDGGTVEKVTDTAESSALAVSSDGSKVVWEVVSGNRSDLRVRDLIKGTERLLLIRPAGPTWICTTSTSTRPAGSCWSGASAHTVTTWWSGGGKPVKVRQVRLGDHVPVDVAGGSVGGQW